MSIGVRFQDEAAEQQAGQLHEAQSARDAAAAGSQQLQQRVSDIQTQLDERAAAADAAAAELASLRDAAPAGEERLAAAQREAEEARAAAGERERELGQARSQLQVCAPFCQGGQRLKVVDQQSCYNTTLLVSASRHLGRLPLTKEAQTGCWLAAEQQACRFVDENGKSATCLLAPATQEQAVALEAANGEVGELEARVAESAEQAGHLSRECADLQATLAALQRTLGAKDPKVSATDKRLHTISLCPVLTSRRSRCECADLELVALQRTQGARDPPMWD